MKATSLVNMSRRAPISAANTSANVALSRAIRRVSANKVDHKLNVERTSCLQGERATPHVHINYYV